MKGKEERAKAIRAVRDEAQAFFAERLAETDIRPFKALFEDMEQEILRKSIVEKGIRTDGRKPDEIRPITCEIDVLPRTHGSALFTRGETQALVVTTLGTALDEQIMDNIDGDSKKSFMLHYNFPPFSVGETGTPRLARAGARSATATSRSAQSRGSCLPRKTSRTRCASSRRSWNPTAPPPWPLSAEAP